MPQHTVDASEIRRENHLEFVKAVVNKWDKRINYQPQVVIAGILNHQQYQLVTPHKPSKMDSFQVRNLQGDSPCCWQLRIALCGPQRQSVLQESLVSMAMFRILQSFRENQWHLRTPPFRLFKDTWEKTPPGTSIRKLYKFQFRPIFFAFFGCYHRLCFLLRAHNSKGSTKKHQRIEQTSSGSTVILTSGESP